MGLIPGFLDNSYDSKKIYLTVNGDKTSYLFEDFLFIKRNED